MNYQLPISFVAIALALIAIGIGAFNFGNQSEFSDADITNYIQENKAWIISQLGIKDVEDYNDKELRDLITALQNNQTEHREVLLIHQNEIIKNKKLIEERVPLGSGDDTDTGSSGSGTTTPTITISLESTEYFRGEIVWIEGKTDPREQVEAVIKTPNRDSLGRILYDNPQANSDGNGNYKIAYITEFTDSLGKYEVYVESADKKSVTLEFTLKE